MPPEPEVRPLFFPFNLPPAFRVLVLLLVLAWGGFGPAQPALAQLPAGQAPSPFGLGAYLHRVAAQPLLLDRLADLAGLTGAGWTREEFNWNLIEPRPGEYHQPSLEALDQVVAQAAARGIEVVGLITGASGWSSGGLGPSTEAQFRDFASFVAFLVDRYRDRIRFWEIWNEPNVDVFWPPRPNPAAYVRLLTLAAEAARAVNPEVRIIGGSVAELKDLFFVFSLFILGAGESMDILSIHPYTSPEPLEGSTTEYNLSLLSGLAALFGPPKPVWVTEIGFPTCQGSPGVTEADQARLLVRAYLTLQAAGVETAAWYDLKDDGLDPLDCGSRFGLVTHQADLPPLRPRPAFQAFRTMAGLLAGSSFSRKLDLGFGRRGLVFDPGLGGTDTRTRTLALWLVTDPTKAGDQERTEPLELPLRGRVDSVVDLFGQPLDHSFDGQSLSLTLSGSPVYVQGWFEP